MGRRHLLLFLLVAAVATAGCAGLQGPESDGVNQPSTDKQAPATVFVEEIATPGTIPYNGSATVVVTVSNSGDTTISESLTLTFDGEGFETRTIELTGDAQRDIEISLPITGAEAGQHIVAATAGDSDTSAAVEIGEPEPAELLLTGLTVSENVAYDESLQVNATVGNNGQVSGEANVTVGIGTESVSASVSVEPRTETNLTLFIPTPDRGGQYVVDVSGGETGVKRRTLVTHPSPYNQRELPVYLSTNRTDRDARPELRDTIRYWNTDGQEYLDYPLEFTLTNNRSAARVLFRIKTVDTCGNESSVTIQGCADLPGERAPPSVTATVDTQLTRPTRYHTAVHELGHILNLSHGEEPMQFMGAVQPGPFSEQTVSIAIVDANRPERVREEIRDGFDGLQNFGADVPTIEFVSDRAAARVAVREYDDNAVCDFETGGSCADRNGPYRDQDVFRLVNLPTDRYGWHFGRLVWPVISDEPYPDILESRDVEERNDFGE